MEMPNSKIITFLFLFLLIQSAIIVSAQDTTGFQYLTDTTKIDINSLKTQAHNNRLLPSTLPWELQFRFTTSQTTYQRATTRIRREELKLLLAKNLSFIAPFVRDSSMVNLVEYIRLHSIKTKYDFQIELDESVWYGKEGYSTFLKFFLERAIYTNELFISELIYKIYDQSGSLKEDFLNQEIAYTKRSISAIQNPDWWPETSYSTIGFSLGVSGYYHDQVLSQMHFRMQANEWLGDIHPIISFSSIEALNASLMYSFDKVERSIKFNIGVGGEWTKQSFFPDPFIISEVQWKLYQLIDWNKETLIFNRPANIISLNSGLRIYPISRSIGMHVGISYSIFGTNSYTVIR